MPTRFEFSEVTLKVLRKDHLPPEVGLSGSFSKLFIYLCNDEEERVKLIAFGRKADDLVGRFSENSVKQCLMFS